MLNFDEAVNIFNQLYRDIDGHEISTQARRKIAYCNKTLTYGEVTPETFFTILNKVNPQTNEIFYDLGCGTGKAVFLAAFFADFKLVNGIELLPELYDTCQMILRKWENKFEHRLKAEHFMPDIKFINSNFLEYDFSNADVVFTHSTCFSEEMMKKLEKKLVDNKKGTRIITVTKWLEAPFLRLLEKQEYPFTWGTGTVSIYEKIM